MDRSDGLSIYIKENFDAATGAGPTPTRFYTTTTDEIFTNGNNQTRLFNDPFGNEMVVFSWYMKIEGIRGLEYLEVMIYANGDIYEINMEYCGQYDNNMADMIYKTKTCMTEDEADLTAINYMKKEYSFVTLIRNGPGRKTFSADNRLVWGFIKYETNNLNPKRSYNVEVDANNGDVLGVYERRE